MLEVGGAPRRLADAGGAFEWPPERLTECPPELLQAALEQRPRPDRDPQRVADAGQSGERPHRHPPRPHSLRDGRRPRYRHEHEVRRRRKRGEPHRRQLGGQALAQRDGERHVLPHPRGVARQRRHGRSLGDRAHLVGPARLLHLGHQRRRAECVPDAQPREPERLGQRAHHHDAPAAEREVRVVHPRELRVRLVEQHHARRTRHHPLDHRARHARPGRVVRRAEIDDPGAGRQHGVRVHVVRRGEPHRHRRECVHAREDRDHREARVRVGDDVARLAERPHRRVEHVVGAAPRDDVLRRHPRVRRERPLELRRVQRRVARHHRRGRLAHRALRLRGDSPEVGVVRQVDRARLPVGGVQRDLPVRGPLQVSRGGCGRC